MDGADVLIDDLVADNLLADKGYDADERVIERLEKQGKTPVIPPKRNRTIQRESASGDQNSDHFAKKDD